MISRSFEGLLDCLIYPQTMAITHPPAVHLLAAMVQEMAAIKPELLSSQLNRSCAIAI